MLEMRKADRKKRPAFFVSRLKKRELTSMNAEAGCAESSPDSLVKTRIVRVEVGFDVSIPSKLTVPVGSNCKLA